MTAHTAPLEPDFPLDDLPGGAGRIDVLCRCVTSAFLLSHGLREEVRFHAVLRDQYVVTFDGTTLSRVNPDERSTAALFQKALEWRHQADYAEGNPVSVESVGGLSVASANFSRALDQASDRGTVVLLHEDGEVPEPGTAPGHPVFVLSDHRPFEPEEREAVEAVAEETWCLSPRALHAHQAITLVHGVLDGTG